MPLRRACISPSCRDVYFALSGLRASMDLHRCSLLAQNVDKRRHRGLAANTYFPFFSPDLFSCSCFHQEQWKDAHTTTGRLPKPTAAFGVCCYSCRVAVRLQCPTLQLQHQAGTDNTRGQTQSAHHIPGETGDNTLSRKNVSLMSGKGGSHLPDSMTLKM